VIVIGYCPLTLIDDAQEASNFTEKVSPGRFMLEENVILAL
jgi:hypothetical protein